MTDFAKRFCCGLAAVWRLLVMLWPRCAPLGGKACHRDCHRNRWPSGETTRFFAELTAETGFTATVLPEPYRVVIDLENVNFDLPPGAGQKVSGLVTAGALRHHRKGQVRIVIDTDGPVLIKQSQLLPKKGKVKAAHCH